MKLIMFDVDGTLVDSMKVDEVYFVDSVKEAFEIQSVDTDWNNYPHATESCILENIIKNAHERNLEKHEIDSFIKIFHLKLENFIKTNPTELVEILGANKFINELTTKKEYAISIATGGYRETIQLKLEKAGVDIKNLPFACSHDGISREEIMKIAENKSKKLHGIEEFEEVIYFGDGLWDYKACKNLNYKFIAVTKDEKKFNEYKLTHVIENYKDLEKIYNCING